jgi:EAL domain-containing protein (putative c-di-GMP-specific phosphodiesterase class I)
MIALDEIKTGLTQEEFFLEYLPTVSLTDGRCIGAEALIRWKRASGTVPPGEFIPVTDNTPLSGLITYWVIDTVAAEMKDWLHANPGAHISINVPPEILGRGGIAYSAGKSGLLELAPQLILEITARGVPDLLGIQAINDNWGSGVRVALDDVTNVGGANLSVLARCNFHIIKLDRSLVSQITPQEPSPNWLKGIAALIRASRLQVVAEGVETEQQLNALRKANIQAAQGFYFSRPVPAEGFIAFHRSWG